MSGGGHACAERLLLPEALSGRLEPAEEKRVMAHVEHCTACQDAAADIEVSLIALAVLKDDEANPVLIDVRSGGTSGVEGLLSGLSVVHDPVDSVEQVEPVEPAEPVDELAARVAARRSRPVWAVRGMAAAAAVVLLAGGAVIGRQLLPPRDTEHYGAPIALTPPAAAADQVARGSVAVAPDGAALVVRLNATGLKDVGWYECVWVAGGQSRSAGSFRATGGVVKNVELRVAQPQDSQAWDLQVVAHQGLSSQVVLEGRRT